MRARCSRAPALVLVRLAALAADPRRAAILVALMGGRPLTAKELARAAGVSATTVCDHLSKLTRSELLAAGAEGRHRWYRLASPLVMRLLDRLTIAAVARPRRSTPGGTASPCPDTATSPRRR